MNEFTINKYLALKFENNQTVIYVDGKRFQQCKYLLLNIPVKKLTALEDLKSVDEISDTLDNSLHFAPLTRQQPLIPPDVEFWGHCSNLQVWYENEYNTSLLHTNLAFPLLRALCDTGDPLARKVFVEEIAKRFDSEYLPVMLSLMMGGYLEYLDPDQLGSLKFFNKIKTPRILSVMDEGGDPQTLMFESFKQYLVDIKPKTINEWVIKAKMLRVFKGEAQVELCFKEAMKKFPKNEELLFAYVRDLNERGRHDEATIVMEELIQGVPENALYQVGLGFMQLQQKKFTDAITHFQKALELNPEMVLSKLHMAEAYHGAKEIVERDKILMELYVHDNLDVSILRELALFSAAIGKTSYATPLLKKVLYLLPDDADSWFELALIYKDSRKNLHQRRCLKKVKVLSRDPRLSSEALNLLGLSYIEAENWKFMKGLKCFQEAVRLDPDNEMAWANQTPVYAMLMDIERSGLAIDISKKIKELKDLKIYGNPSSITHMERELEELKERYWNSPFKCPFCKVEIPKRPEKCPSCGGDLNIAIKQEDSSKTEIDISIRELNNKKNLSSYCVLGNLEKNFQELAKISSKYCNQENSLNFTVPNEFLPNEKELISMFHPPLNFGHRFGANTITTTTEGKYLVSGGSTLKIWDLEKGCHVRTLYGDFDSIKSLLTHKDRIISGSRDGTIRLWNIHTGDLINSMVSPFKRVIQFVEVDSLFTSPDSKYLYSVLYCEEGFANVFDRIEVWNLKTRTFEGIIEHGLESFRHPVLSPDGKYFVGIVDWENVGIIDIQTGQIIRVIKNFMEKPKYDDMEPDYLVFLNITPDGKYILAYSEYGYLKKIDFNSGEILNSTKCRPGNLLEISPNGKIITLGFQILDGNTLNKIRDLEYPPSKRSRDRRIEDAIFTVDSKYLITASDSLRKWDSSEGTLILDIKGIGYGTYTRLIQGEQAISLINHEFFRWKLKDGLVTRRGKSRGDTEDLFHVPYDGKYFITDVFMDKWAGDRENGGIHIWDINTLKHIKHLKNYWFGGIDLTGKYLAVKNTSIHSKVLYIFELPSAELVKEIKISNKCNQYLEFSPTKTQIANSLKEKNIQIIDFTTGNIQNVIETNTEIRAFKYTPDGNYIIGGSPGKFPNFSDSSFTIWDVSTGEVVRNINKHTERVYNYGFSRDGKYIATGASDRKVYVWDFDDGIYYGPFNHLTSIYQIEFIKGNKYLATVDSDSNVYIWDYLKGDQHKIRY